MKNLILFFIKYSVPTNILIIAIFIFGIIGLNRTKSSFFPLTPTRNIQIQVFYPGSSPAEIEEGIIQKIEENLKGITGIDRITSRSNENRGVINVELLKGQDANDLLQEVKNAVDAVNSYPGDMESPIVSKLENLRSSFAMGITGKDIPLKTIKSISRDIENNLLSLPGISKVSLRGFPEEEIEIAVRENDLRAYSLTFNDIARAVRNANIIVTGGNVKTDEEKFTIRAFNKNYYAEEIDHIIVKTTVSGNVIRLKDIAKVTNKFSETPDLVTLNGEISGIIEVKNTNAEDLLTGADKITEYIETFNKKHDNIEIITIQNVAYVLNQRTNLLLKNAWQGIILVLIFLAVFLTPRLAFWVAIGLPISMLGFFIFGSSFDVTINVLSLFGLIIVIGILVDDGIIISENIYRYYEQGYSPVQAAIKGTLEVAPAIISAILTTIVAFSTFFFVDGRVGDLFSEIAIVVSITLVISLVEALVILPAHLAHSGALKKNKKVFKINIWGDKILNWVRIKTYEPALRFFLNHRFIGLSIFIMIFLITIGARVGGIIKFEFFPKIASEQVVVNLVMPQGTSETITKNILTYIEEKAWKVGEEFNKIQSGDKPVIRFVESHLGPGTNVGSLSIFLLEGDERDFPSRDFSLALRKNVGSVYGIESLTYDAGTNFGGKPISISIESENVNDLKSAVEMLKTHMSNDPRLADIEDDDPEGVKEIRIKLKPNAYLLGFTLNNIMSQLRGGFHGVEAQRLQRGRDEIKVWVRYDRKNRMSISHMEDMRLTSPTGDKIPFSEIGTYKIERGDVTIRHLDGKRVITVSSMLGETNNTASQIMDEMKKGIIQNMLSKFPAVDVSYEGQSRVAAKVMDSALTAGITTLILILIIIAFTFRTYGKQFLFLPIIVFSLVGVHWGHYIHGLSVNILSILGIIALIGILVNDGLVLIQKFNLNIKQGQTFQKAIFNAASSRFRPIVLTTITTVAGLSPLLFETSRQAQFLIPMAISIVYGISFATVLTMILLPILLSYENSLKRFLVWAWTGKWKEKRVIERAYTELKEEKAFEKD